MPTFTPGLWACAACTAVTVWLLIRDPRAALRRVEDPGQALGQRDGPSWLRGHPAAAPFWRRLLVAGIGAAALVLLASRFSGVGAGWLAAGWPAATFGLAVALGHLEPLAARRRRHELVLHSPQALELMSACLAAGLPVRQACRAIVGAFGGAVGEDLTRVLALVDLGVPDVDAWRVLQEHPELGPAARDIARSVESGTMMVESLRHHAAVARLRREAALQVRARSVGVRSVLPLMTCFIPSFLLLGVVPSVVSAVSHALA